MWYNHTMRQGNKTNKEAVGEGGRTKLEKGEILRIKESWNLIGPESNLALPNQE